MLPLPLLAGLALPGREAANEGAMNPCSGMNCAYPCDQDYCHSPFEHGGKEWEGDKCFLERCMGCEPCKSTTPPRASKLCFEKDTWAPKFLPNNPRRACNTWASKLGAELKETCNADTADGRWAQEHCAFTCCLVTKNITPMPGQGAGGAPASPAQQAAEEDDIAKVEAGMDPTASAATAARATEAKAAERGRTAAGAAERGAQPSPSPSAGTRFASASASAQPAATATTTTAASETTATATTAAAAAKGSSETTIAIGFLTRGDLPLFSKVPWGATPNPT